MLQAEYYHVKEAVLDNLAWTLYPTIPLAALLAWRLWTFTIRPALKPEEPPFLPYWVPCKSPEAGIVITAETDIRGFCCQF